MRSRSRIARAMRSMAAGMSRRVSGSCSSSNAGWRNRCAAAGSGNPRCTSTLAAAGPTCRAADKGETPGASGVGSTQRGGGLILGVIPAKRVAFVRIALGQCACDLVFRDQKFLVTVRLEFVHVEGVVVIERQFERASHAFVDGQLTQAGLGVPLLATVHPGNVQLLQQGRDVAALELRRWETDRMRAGCWSGGPG